VSCNVMQFVSEFYGMLQYVAVRSSGSNRKRGLSTLGSGAQCVAV